MPYKSISNKINKLFLFACAATFAITLIPGAKAAMPPGFETQVITGGLNLPVAVEYTPTGEILIAEKGGTVRIFHDGHLHETPLITLTDVNDYGDRGLIGMALDPDFTSNGYLYLLYTYENNPANYEGPKTSRLIRVTVSGDTTVPGSETVILGSVVGDSTNPSCEDFPTGTDCIGSDGASHTVNDLVFGPDGKLYVSIGDASSFDIVDPLAHRALDLDKLNGKVLRINPDGTGPADNPFYDGDPTANRSKVWNYGLRNPFRIGFRPTNNSLYIGDVGWYSYEEINVGTSGANFGWPCHEGPTSTPGYNCESPTHVDPLYYYEHDATTGAGSITGGAFYEGASNYPAEYADTYFFGDFAQNWIKRAVVDTNDNLISVEDFSDNPGGPVEFLIDPDGNVNYLSIYSGELIKITYTDGNRTPIAQINASPNAGLPPLEVSFDSASSTDPDGDTLTSLWDFGDNTTSTEASPLHTYNATGTYQVLLTVNDGNGGIATDTASILVGGEAPTASILNPPNNSLYNPGQIIPLEGRGIDPDEGALPESAYSWRLILHHNIHIHILQSLSGSNPSFVAPDHGSDPDVYIEAELTVTDSTGLTDTTSIDLHLAPPTTVDPYHLSTAVSPTSPKPNTPITITSTIGNNGTADPILVDIEVFDAANTKVAQIFYDNTTIPTNETATYTLDWTPTQEGTYRVSVGLIHAGWQGLYEWTDNALTFSVTDTWTPVSPNGALEFDGINDYINTEVWDIEELQGFTLEARFVADSFNGDTLFIGKATGTSTPEYDWGFGLREISPTEAELLYIIKADGVLTELTGGTVSIGELVHASAVYNNSTMELYKNGVPVASTPKTGLISMSGNSVWLGNVPADPAINAFDGVFDEIRVWNEPQSPTEIVQFQGELTQKQFGLIKDWRFNEGFGQVVIDSSNSGHHGLLGSATSTDQNDPTFIAGKYSPGGVFTPTHSTTTITPNLTAPNAPVTISTNIENTGDGAGFMIVDIEVFDETDTKVHQAVFDGEGFAPGEIRSFDTVWTPTTEGTYKVEVGLVHLFWNDVYEWIGAAGTFTVDATATNTPPTITILGDNPTNLIVSDTFTDPGATASDAEDGDLTASIIVGGDLVDTNATGTYAITYNVTDSGGLGAPEQTRTVVVSESTSTPFALTHTNTTVSTNPSTVNTPVTVTASITNTGSAGNGLIDIEIYDAGTKVAQAFYDNEAFSAGQTQNFTLDFTPTHTGNYGIAIGLFEPGWANLYEWVGESAVLTVSDSTSTPPKTSVYKDSLETGWASWSYDVAANFADTTTVFEGTNSIEVTFTGIWGGLYLHNDAIDTTGNTFLSFTISGGPTGGQSLQLRPYDALGAELPAVPLANYLTAGTLEANTWQTVKIPLTDLNLENTVTTGFLFQGNTGSIEDTFYLDDISFE